MSKHIIEAQTELQRMAAERAIALTRELESVAAKASNGQVIQSLEQLLLSKGRDDQRLILEELMQHTADEAVKKGGAHKGAAVTPVDTKAHHPETL